jgi:tetratricopeptide (TPR) repeat protein
MKNHILFLLFFLFSFFLSAQNSGEVNSSQVDKAAFSSMYKTAVSYKDTSSMIVCLLGMVNANQSDTASLKSLAILYSARKNHYAAALAAKKYTAIVDNNTSMVELFAISAHNSLLYDEALLGYTELYLRTKDIYYKYMSAFMEYELLRQADCLKTLEFCFSKPETESTEIRIRRTNGEFQLISLKAVCLNLKGLVFIDTKEYVKAKEAFEQAIAISPEFDSARLSLEETKKLMTKQ